MRRILFIVIFFVLLKSWAFAYDFKADNKQGFALCYDILTDSTVALTFEGKKDGNNPVPNYSYIYCDTLYIPETISYNNRIYTVSDFREAALMYLQNVKALYIPKTISFQKNNNKMIPWESHYFHNSVGRDNSIQEYVVDDDHPFFSTKNGILYSKDKKVLFQYPPSKPNNLFIMPEGIEEIDMMAIWNNNIKTIETPLSLKNIAIAAFQSESIEELVFQDSLESIGWLAFVYIYNLRRLVFGNRLDSAMFANIAYYNPVTVECRTSTPPICEIRAGQNKYIGSSTLFVPRKSVTAYQMAEGWNQFGTIHTIEPPIVSGVNEAEVSWVQNFSATGYVWHLYSDAEHTQLVMTLTFDDRGYLIGLTLGDSTPLQAAADNPVYVPQRTADDPDEGDSEPTRRYAEYYSFTIHSLSPGRQYYYVRQSLAGERVIDEETGSFETLPDGAPTGINPLLFEPQPQKTFENGMLRIRKNGNTYNVNGTKVE